MTTTSPYPLSLSGHDVANGIHDDLRLVVVNVVARVFDLDEGAARRLPASSMKPLSKAVSVAAW